MNRLPAHILTTLSAACVMLVADGVVFAADRSNPEIAGAVRLNNGLILYGLCDLANTIDPGLQPSRLELRRINQQFRTYFVSTRRAGPPQPDELAVPKYDFRIVQHRTSRRPLNLEIGWHSRPPFAPDGTSQVTVNLGQGQRVTIDIGVTAINADRVLVSGLSHDWEFGVAMVAVPETTLYAGRDAPGLLKCVRQFESGDTQLNMVQMLLHAEKYTAAQMLLADIADQFPDLQQRCDRLVDVWNDRVGKRVLEELNVLRDTGKYETARYYSRAWPDEKLAPVIRVKARQFLDALDEDRQRLTSIKEALNVLIADIADDDLRRQAAQVWNELERLMDANTLPRLTAFELLQLDPGLAPESKLALAATGTILGADQAIDNFPEAYGLFQMRFLLQDYLRTTDDEQNARNTLLEQIRQQEGYSVERVAALLQSLPPVLPVTIDDRQSETPGHFRMAATESSAACVGRVPAEYSATRRYPLILAFRPAHLSTEDTLSWWQQAADRDGYIVVVPELYEETEVSYAATAGQHRRFLSLLRRLKSSLAVDDDRVFIAGHEIGGEAAMDLATAHPDLFAGIISIAGLGRKHLRWTALNSLSLPWYVVVGGRQPGFYQRMGTLLERMFKRKSGGESIGFVDLLLVRYEDRGFETFAEEIPNLFRWLNLQKRPADPEQINATLLRSTDQSWFWLELDSIPERFVGMDHASTFDDQPSAEGTVAARINSQANLIHLRTLPDDVHLRLGPNTPGLNLAEKINVRSVSGRIQSIQYEPSVRDLLEDFRIRRDRSRLCYMKVPVDR
ncbi:MAG: hypothetical protein R3C59_17150 [Planctomycetaceae bacterium]